MGLDLPDLLDLSPEDVLNHAFLMQDDSGRLQRILYCGLSYLQQRQRNKIMILDAWEDTYTLYQFFFDKKSESFQKFCDQTFAENSRLAFYAEVNGYLASEIEALKLTYLSEVDVLEALLQVEGVAQLSTLPEIKTNFTNAEFFAVLALHYVALALEALDNVRIYMAQPEKNEDALTVTETPASLHQIYVDYLKEAHFATLEAQVAIDRMTYHHELSASRFSKLIQHWLTFHQRSLAKKSHFVRYGDKHERRREKAWEWFQAAKQANPDQSDHNIIASIVEAIQEYSDKIQLPRLKLGNEIDSIYRMILRKRKALLSASKTLKK